MDLANVICTATMKAAIEIADRRGLRQSLEAAKLSEALKIEVKAGFDLTVAEFREAFEVIGEPMAKASLNANCILMASKALARAGYLATEAGRG